MKLSFTNLGCPNWSLEQIAEKAAEYGYDGVELRSHADNPYLFPYPPLAHREYIKKLFGKYNLEISCISAYSRFADSDAQKLEENKQILINDIILARDIGAPMVRSFLGENKDLTNEQVIEYAAPYLNYCADFADMLGIKVVFETHDAWCGGDLMKLAFSKISSNGAAVLWDVANNHAYGERVAPFFDAIGERCAHVHLKDLYMTEGKSKLCLTGDGEVEIKECIALLRKAGYSGYITFEWEKRWHPEIEEPEIALPHFVKYMRSL